MLPTAVFNASTMQALAPDSGTWEVSGRGLQVSARSNQADAVAVYQVGDALPSTFDVVSTAPGASAAEEEHGRHCGERQDGASSA